MKTVYLDHITRTKPFSRAVKSMLPFLEEQWGTPVAPHQKGQEVLPALERGYKALYTLLDAKEEDTFLLTSSGAEGINQIVETVYYEITREKGKNGFITSNIDEAPSILAIDRLQDRGGVPKMVEADRDGCVSPQSIIEAITPRTALVSLSWANALTGVIQPVAEIGDICRERGILFHLDASHILGKVFFSQEDIGAHFITFSGDVLGGIPGTGGLWVQNGAPCRPFIVGGAEQAGLRAGSWNVPGFVALGSVAQELLAQRDYFCTEVARLRDRLEEGILDAYSEAVSLFREQERLPHATAVAFPGISNEALQYALHRRGVYTSIGGGHLQQIGLVLQASGIQESLAHSALSFSLSLETTEEEIERAIQCISVEANRLRSYSAHHVASLQRIPG